MPKHLLYVFLFLIILSSGLITGILLKKININQEINNLLNRTKGIELTSDVNGVSLEWNDEAGFRKYLDNMNFWGKDRVYDFQNVENAGKTVTANKLIIKLTSDIPNPFYTVSDDNNILWLSLGENINKNGDVEILVYRKDWKNDLINYYINSTLWKMTQDTRASKNRSNLFEGSTQDPKNPNMFLKVIVQ